MLLQIWERLHLSPEALKQLAKAFQDELEAGLEQKSSLLSYYQDSLPPSALT
jgi:hypothetical protein